MDAPFPFGFPFPTAFYLSFYVLTLAIHVVFMNYVLAGSGYLAIVSLWARGSEPEPDGHAMASVLRDWMPFALGAAITAGVAPLLFVQVLYKDHFYTANLLLFHRWMAIVPVLIVAFYLLYLLKSKVISNWPIVARIGVSVGAFVCFAFTACSWTENHLLSQDQDVWAGFYAAGGMLYWRPELLPRLCLWLAGSVLTMVTLASWQLWFLQRRGAGTPDGTAARDTGREGPFAREPRRASMLALCGLVISAVCAGLYYLASDDSARGQFTDRLAGPYFAAALVGLFVQAVAWTNQARQPRFAAKWLWLASGGVLLTIVGVTVTREAIRLAAIDVPALYDQHARAGAIGGFPVFVVSFVVAALLIAWSLVTAKRGVKPV